MISPPPVTVTSRNHAMSKTRPGLPHSDGELMAEKQILSLNPAPRLEQVGDEHSKRVQDRKHRSQ